MTTGLGHGHSQGRKGQFCVKVDPVSRTAGKLADNHTQTLNVNGPSLPADMGRILSLLGLTLAGANSSIWISVLFVDASCVVDKRYCRPVICFCKVQQLHTAGVVDNLHTIPLHIILVRYIITKHYRCKHFTKILQKLNGLLFIQTRCSTSSSDCFCHCC